MRNADTERDEGEYRLHVLPDDPSDVRGGKAGEDAARNAEKTLPQEPDLELLAKMIREELERERKQIASEQDVADAQPAERTPTEAPEEAPEDALEDAPAVTPEVAPEEVPEEVPEEAPEEALEDTPTETPEEVPEEVPEYAPEEALGEAPGETPGAAPEEVPEEAPKETPEEARIRKIRGVFEYLETFCVALGVMILLFMFVFRYVSVDGDSMEHTLHGNQLTPHADRLIISDFLYEPKTGDIVVINTGTSEQPLIKRVIAVGGQTVRINFETWEVTVDGVLLEEDYIWRRDGQPMVSRDMPSMYGVDENGVCEFTVGEGKVFVMGDNRNNSKDSRFREIGEQDVEHILGKVILRLYPLSEFGSV